MATHLDLLSFVYSRGNIIGFTLPKSKPSLLKRHTLQLKRIIQLPSHLLVEALLVPPLEVADSPLKIQADKNGQPSDSKYERDLKNAAVCIIRISYDLDAVEALIDEILST